MDSLLLSTSRCATGAALLALVAGCTVPPPKSAAQGAAAQTQPARVVERDLSGAPARRAP
jgi:hypothetical protein